MDSFDFYCELAIPKKEPIKIEFENDRVLAFHHTKPVFETHIVVVPKECIRDFASLEERHKDLLWELQQVIALVINKLGLKEDGVRVRTNLGKYQDTPHLHFHVLSGKELT